MAVDHLTIGQYSNNIQPKKFRPTIFQRFHETANLVISPENKVLKTVNFISPAHVGSFDNAPSVIRL